MDNINMQNIITRNEKIMVADMDDEIVTMNIETGNYYNLGKTGSVIWNMLERPISVEALIEELKKKYNVSEEQCKEETLAFLNQLNKEGLITVK
jgi:hypothetical protein